MPLCKERLNCKKFNINNAGCHNPKGYFCFVGIEAPENPAPFGLLERFVIMLKNPGPIWFGHLTACCAMPFIFGGWLFTRWQFWVVLILMEIAL